MSNDSGLPANRVMGTDTSPLGCHGVLGQKGPSRPVGLWAGLQSLRADRNPYAALGKLVQIATEMQYLANC
jgi:hypothetical protein